MIKSGPLPPLPSGRPAEEDVERALSRFPSIFGELPDDEKQAREAEEVRKAISQAIAHRKAQARVLNGHQADEAGGSSGSSISAGYLTGRLQLGESLMTRAITSEELPSEAIRGYLIERIQLECGLSDEQIIGQMRHVHWFRSLPYGELHALYRRGRHKLFQRYGNIFREGSEGSSFFLLLRGSVRMHSAERGTSTRLTTGASFGEDALITTRVRRDASVVAETDCYILILSAADMHAVEGGGSPQLSAIELRSEVRPRVVAWLMPRMRLLRSVLPNTARALAPLMEVHEFASGAIVFHESEEPSALTGVYLLLEGRVRLSKRDPVLGIWRTIGERAAQDETSWFGEGALSNHALGAIARPRPCTAACTEPTRCLVVRAPHFEGFLNAVPKFLSLASERVGRWSNLNSLAHS